MRPRFFPLTLLLLVIPALASAACEIRHLEPMHWWVGMKDPQLQLMIHGPQIADLAPSADYPGVAVTGIERTDNPNYLFVTLRIGPTAAPGSVPLVFRRAGAVVLQREYRLEAREPGSADRRGFDARDAIYLVTPDRFANGDPANDTQPGLAEAADRANPVSRHGGDLAGLRRRLDYISGLGFTMLWPMPLLENDQARYSYHGYSITDLYRVDPRFGSNADYRALVADARARGLGVIQDIVLNHIGTGHWWMRDLPARDWVNFPSHPVFTNNRHFTIPDLHAAEEDRERFASGWFDTTMPDLNQRQPLLARYLIQNTIWWIEYAGLAGLREDTLSYADRTFLRDWSAAVLREYPHLNIVGEEMDEQPHLTAYWQKGAANRDGYDSGVPSITDFPVADLIAPALTAPDPASGVNRLYETIAADYLYADPMNLLVFADNHDRPRLFSRLQDNPALLRTALLFLATTRGIPQVYYGTEMLIPSPLERNDGVLRADMPGGWPGDRVNAFTGAGLTPAQRDTQEFVRRLFGWRKTCAAITTGQLVHFAPDSGCYVYFRLAGADRVMVVLNAQRAASTLDLARFARLLAGARSGRDAITGETIDLTVPLQLPALQSIAIEYRAAP